MCPLGFEDGSAHLRLGSYVWGAWRTCGPGNPVSGLQVGKSVMSTIACPHAETARSSVTTSDAIGACLTHSISTTPCDQ